MILFSFILDCLARYCIVVASDQKMVCGVLFFGGGGEQGLFPPKMPFRSRTGSHLPTVEFNPVFKYSQTAHHHTVLFTTYERLEYS